MVSKVEFKTKYAGPDFVDSIARGVRSAASSGVAFVVSSSKMLPEPVFAPVRGVFRPPMRGPSMPSPVPNPVAGIALVAIVLWELYQGIAPVDSPPPERDVEQWQRDLDDMGRLSREIVTLQHQIQLYETWGMGDVAQILKNKLNALIVKSNQIAESHPVMGHYLQAKAVVESGALASSVSLPGGVTVVSDPADDLQQFVGAADAIFLRIQKELIQRIDREHYHLAILSWYDAVVVPRLLIIQDALISLSAVPGVDDVILQELYQRNHSLLVVTPMYLKAGLLDTVRRFASPGASALSSIIEQVAANYPGKVKLIQSSLDGIRVASSVDLDAFKTLLDDLVHLAAENPKHPGDVVHVEVDLFSGALIFSSNNERFNLDLEHPLIRQHADALEFMLEINHHHGHGMTVVMIPPAGMLEVDPFQYVLGCRGNLDEIRFVVADMAPEQRIAMLRGEMGLVLNRAEDQVLSVAIDVAVEKSASNESLQELRRTSTRFEQVIQMLIEDLPPRHGAVRMGNEMMKQLKIKSLYPELY